MVALDCKRKQADCGPGFMFRSFSFTSYAVSRAACSHRAWQAFGLKDHTAISQDLRARHTLTERAAGLYVGTDWPGGHMSD